MLARDQILEAQAGSPQQATMSRSARCDWCTSKLKPVNTRDIEGGNLGIRQNSDEAELMAYMSSAKLSPCVIQGACVEQWSRNRCNWQSSQGRLQVDNQMLDAFNKETRNSQDAQSTPRERFGLVKKKTRRKKGLQSESAGKDDKTLMPENLFKKPHSKAHSSFNHGKGDPSLPDSMAGEFQVQSLSCTAYSWT